MPRSPLPTIGLTAVLLIAVNGVLILDVAAMTNGELGVLARVRSIGRAPGSVTLSGNLADDAVALVLRTGVPERYGSELGITFPNPADQNAMNVMMAKMSKFDPAYGSARIALSPELKARYTAIGLRISCEFCCGAKAIVFENGEAACGCAHSQAMRGLAAYLLANHANEYTDDEILRELAAWKGLYFPKQMVQKLTMQVRSGTYTPDIAALLLGIPEADLKRLGASGAVTVPSAIQGLPSMSGGC